MKIQCWYQNAYIIFNEHINSGDLYYIDDPAILDSFNSEYFSWFCNFSKCVGICQACKDLHDKLRWYKQGINLDEDHPAFANNQNKEDNNDNFGADNPP